jgi:hypothetical protein
MHRLISSKRGMSLNLDAGDHAAYQEEDRALARKYQQRTRDKYGIYASNQGKFVQTVEELNEWDRIDGIALTEDEIARHEQRFGIQR